MPTENRSSNTEMVSVPRVLTREMLNGVCMHPDLARSLWSTLLKNAPQAAPQPHPEPIAWMVGTAFWWTKEEAERDAAATGLPIVGLGPMTCPGEVERKSVKRYDRDEVGGHSVVEITVPGLLHHDQGPNLAEALARLAYRVAKFHQLDAPSLAKPGEVERLREQLRQKTEAFDTAKEIIHGHINSLQDAKRKLDDRDALLREPADAPPAAMEFRLQQKVKAALTAHDRPDRSEDSRPGRRGLGLGSR